MGSAASNRSLTQHGYVSGIAHPPSLEPRVRLDLREPMHEMNFVGIRVRTQTTSKDTRCQLEKPQQKMYLRNTVLFNEDATMLRMGSRPSVPSPTLLPPDLNSV